MPASSPVHFSQRHSLHSQVLQYCVRTGQIHDLVQLQHTNHQVSRDSPAPVCFSAQSHFSCSWTSHLHVATCTNFPNRKGNKGAGTKDRGGSPVFTVSAVPGCRCSGRAEMPEGNPRRNGEDAEQRACWKSCSVSTVRDADFRRLFRSFQQPWNASSYPVTNIKPVIKNQTLHLSDTGGKKKNPKQNHNRKKSRRNQGHHQCPLASKLWWYLL